ncbi:MAG: CRISPR-associated RAMP protein Csx7 [archaeon YNP-LCB-003-016]|uniref:type III CRISPR-associated RAMP protein Csx7 n=1 Tax=Candidatus Culexarchaeum yellowstonense TaxID=2928963 RepID=UPI0026ED21C1|nr:CRISPR-associated RAMP protein Csx7 [Candidatus Culexarchaeum yellowstonense]MCR6692651.1 CRISPR-associated RAMP protein Csx7 [Candidatus Culexarchaeum yellowstonense]
MSLTLWTSSSTILREATLKGYMENVSPLRIGVGREPPLGSRVDLAVIRVKYGEYDIPYIPGSSLKGLFRSHAGRIASSYGLKVCSGLSKESCVEIKRVTCKREGYEGEYILRNLIERLMRDGKSSDAMEEFFGNTCILCKMFGSMGYRSKVSFSDAYPIDDEGRILPFKFGSRTGIAIDRRTGAVVGGALYEVEYVEPGCRFKFEIRCSNLPNYALGLLGSILRMIDNGEVRIGGFTSRGYGLVKIRNLNISIKDYTLKGEGKVLPSLEVNVDESVDVSDLAELKDGQLCFQDDKAWALIDRLEEVWRNATDKIKRSEKQA